MKIYVGKRDIANGNRKNQYSCPVALAIHRKANIQSAFVMNSKVIITEKSGKKKEIKLPESAQQFIAYFDSSGEGLVWPFSFNLNYEPEVTSESQS